MNKIKKIFTVIQRKCIAYIDGVVNSRVYMRFYLKYLKKIGVDIKGNPIYIHPTVNFDGIDYRRIHIGNDVVISRNVLLLIHDYSISCGLRMLGGKREWKKNVGLKTFG